MPPLGSLRNEKTFRIYNCRRGAAEIPEADSGAELNRRITEYFAFLKSLQFLKYFIMFIKGRRWGADSYEFRLIFGE